jgi:hypothetical protein
VRRNSNKRSIFKISDVTVGTQVLTTLSFRILTFKYVTLTAICMGHVGYHDHGCACKQAHGAACASAIASDNHALSLARIPKELRGLVGGGRSSSRFIGRGEGAKDTRRCLHDHVKRRRSRWARGRMGCSVRRPRPGRPREAGARSHLDTRTARRCARRMSPASRRIRDCSGICGHTIATHRIALGTGSVTSMRRIGTSISSKQPWKRAKDALTLVGSTSSWRTRVF